MRRYFLANGDSLAADVIKQLHKEKSDLMKKICLVSLPGKQALIITEDDVQEGAFRELEELNKREAVKQWKKLTGFGVYGNKELIKQFFT